MSRDNVHVHEKRMLYTVISVNPANRELTLAPGNHIRKASTRFPRARDDPLVIIHRG